MENAKVNILLATYNGERFIKEQMATLLEQTYENIDIYIRDDGSSDHTVEILQEIARNNNTSKNIYILENDGVNLRCPGSFYEILKQCKPAKYYSLCDQDDIWYPEKIQWAVERLEKESNDQILLYYTASDYKTVNGELLRTSARQKEQLLLTDVLYYTPGSGFTIVFNEAARRKLILDVNPGTELHDRWLIRGATCFGKVLYDPRSSAAHIRHESAVTAGDSGNSNLLLHFIKNELFGKEPGQEKQFLSYFYETFKNSLSAKDKKTLNLFCSKNTLKNWFQKVFYPKRLRARLSGELLLRILFFFGKI